MIDLSVYTYFHGKQELLLENINCPTTVLTQYYSSAHTIVTSIRERCLDFIFVAQHIQEIQNHGNINLKIELDSG